MADQADYATNSRPSPELIFYPRSNDISINGSDLKIMMRDFKGAIKNILSLPIIFAVVSLWIPIIFVSDIRGFIGLTPDQVETGYVVFASIFTLLLLKHFIITCYIVALRFIPRIPLTSKMIEGLEKFETDADKKVEQVLEFCQNQELIVNVSSLEIISAFYGVDNKFTEVTQKLNELIEDGVLNTTSSNALVSRDPAPGIAKSLKITCLINGRTSTKSFKENESVTLP